MATGQSSLSNVYVGSFGTATEASVTDRRKMLKSIVSGMSKREIPPLDPILEESDMAENEPNERVAKLETHFQYIRRDLDEIRDDQRKILDRTARLPTVGNLWTMIASVAGVAFAIIAIFVGVLTYLRDLNP